MEVADVGEGRPGLGPVTHPRHSADNPASDSAPAPTLCSMPQVRRTWSQDMNIQDMCYTLHSLFVLVLLPTK